MEQYIEIYNRNRKLDDMFMNKYFDIESKYYEKNCLELIVELCELANESKCFKYWTVKKPNNDLVLEEYADSLLMVLYMFNNYNIETLEILDIELSDDILELFNDLIRMCTMLMDKDNVSEYLLKEIFTKLLHIGRVLKLSDNDIYDACLKKIIKNEERLNSDY